MDISFLGGVHKRSCSSPVPAEQASTGFDWREQCATQRLWLRARGLEQQVFHWNTLALVVRGYLRLASSTEPLEPERAAEELRRRYLEEGTLDPTEMEGNATLALLDARAGLVLLARPRNGTNAIYYAADDTGLLFGGNLAEVVAASGRSPQLNRPAALAYLQGGPFPERETLFTGCYRLLPGEMIGWSEQGLRRWVNSTALAGIAKSRSFGEVLADAVRDCAAVRGRPVNVLTGSLGSCALQVLLNRAAWADELAPPSLSVAVDQPEKWDETERAVQAAAVLGTDHQLIAAEGSLNDRVRQMLAATGEPPSWELVGSIAPLARILRSEELSAVCVDGPARGMPGDETAGPGVFHQAALAAGLMNHNGADLFYPLLDSRVVPSLTRPAGGWRLFRKAQPVLREELRRLLPTELGGRGPCRAWRQPRHSEWPPSELLSFRALCYRCWRQLFLDNSVVDRREELSVLSSGS